MVVSWDAYAEADIETLKEIKKEAESYLSAQLTAALAGNQRGMSLIALLAAATVVIVGAGLSVFLGSMKAQASSAIGVGAMLTGVAFLVAMALANVTVMPSTFWYPGSAPHDWEDDVLRKIAPLASLAEQLKNYDDRICENTAILNRNARLLSAAVWVSWGGLVVGVLAVLAAYAR